MPLLQMRDKPFDTRAVVPLRDDAWHVRKDRICKHVPDDFRRREKSEDPEGENGKPVGQFAAHGFGQEPRKILFGEAVQMLFSEAVLIQDRTAIGQQVLPAADAENAVVDVPALFESMCPEKEGSHG